MGKYSPQKHLHKLEDPNLRSLIKSMVEKEPIQRKSAEFYLAEYRGTLFPEYFYSFLQSYMLIFSSTPILTPDEKILRLKKDINNIFTFLGPLTSSNRDKTEEKQDVEKIDKGESEGLVIITSLVTSCIRGLHDCSSKLYSLEILLDLACHASDETVLDRILPYIVSIQLNDNEICIFLNILIYVFYNSSWTCNQNITNILTKFYLQIQKAKYLPLYLKSAVRLNVKIVMQITCFKVIKLIKSFKSDKNGGQTFGI